MVAHRNELSVPARVARDGNAVELLRVWAAGESQQFALRTHWDDPAAWGLLLVDLAKLVASAYAQAGSMEAEQALARIKQGLDAEWSAPTDNPEAESAD